MTGRRCLVIEDYRYRETAAPAREFRCLVSLHNHSSYSVENLASLNDVVRLGYMRPLAGTLQRAFGLEWVSGLNYAELVYNPPFTPEDVLRMESAAAAGLGFDGVHLGITDHDEFAGSRELLHRRPADAARLALGEELTVRYDGHLFHLGVTGLPEPGIEDTHAALQDAARSGRLDEVFETLRAAGCLVVLNHPLIPWAGRDGSAPAEALLKRYGWAVHALEYNGMRRREENDAVLEFARSIGKPLVGGGDSHLFRASAVTCVTQSASFADFAAEVKAGRAAVLIAPDYFAPLRWKLFLRVLYFIAHYRRIARFRDLPVREMLHEKTVLLDPAGHVCRAFLRLVSALGLAR